MKWIQKLISVLLSLGLMFVIMAFCLLSSLPQFLTPETYLSVMEEANVYQSIKENIQGSIDDVMLLNNIERQSMREFIKLEEVKEIVVGDVYAVLSWLNGSPSQIKALDLTTYGERFDDRIGTFFRDNQYYLDDALKQDVELMKQNVMQIMKGNLRLIDFDQFTQMTGLQKFTSLISEMNLKLVAGLLAGCALLLVGVLVLLSPRSRHHKRRKKFELGLLYSGYGIMAGGLIIFILFFSGIQSGFYHHVAIQVSYLQESIGLLIENWFKSLMISGLLSTGLGIIFMVPYWAKLYQKCMKS
ncbi:MAG: hypothetical protein Q4Q00_11345 [Turicibacter sp.]|nr:hypothetical protein [Turicibacter sp.]